MKNFSALCVLGVSALALSVFNTGAVRATDANAPADTAAPAASAVPGGAREAPEDAPAAAPSPTAPQTTGAIHTDDATPPSSATAAAPDAPAAPASEPSATAAEPTATHDGPSTAAATPTESTPAAPPAASTSTPAATPDSTTAQPAQSPAAEAAAAASVPAASPVVEAARKRLTDQSIAGRKNLASDVAAASAFYATRTDALWIANDAYTDKAKSVISELKKAGDWGLEASDFPIAELASGATPEAAGNAEAELTLAALKYARYARGGRLDPLALSNIFDMKPPVKDANEVMKELAEASEPGKYLVHLNPKHDGFEKLRQELLKARGPAEPEAPVDPALLVNIPSGKLIRPGMRNDQVSLLRQRLKTPSENAEDDDLYDEKLVGSVEDYQREHGLRVDGIVGGQLRTALNNEGKPEKADPARNVDRLIANMERWRWLPENLGDFYVLNNTPQFVSEIWKGKELKLRQKMIVGMPSWPTPIMMADMKYVMFRPSWGMPDGIKQKELLPRLRRASNSGNNFFDQLFGGGGGGGGARVLEAYKLQVSYNGQKINPDSINWSTADIRRFSFVQPPGPENPLGLVKFRFPNRHDVYMHDTPERSLFGRSARALSHGCMRVEEPRRTAEILLQEDKGYSEQKVGELWNSGADVTLDRPVPVYLAYFTARVDDSGRLATYGDIYGFDSRVMSALRGRPVRYNAPEAIDPSSGDVDSSYVSDAGGYSDSVAPTRKTNNKKTARSKREPKSAGTTLQDALSNIFLN